MKHAATSAATTALHDLEQAAHAAQSAETAYRAEAAREIARLERDRIYAHRRIRLVRLLADAAVRCEAAAVEVPAKSAAAVTAVVAKVDAVSIAAAQRRAVAAEFGWDVDGERHKAVLDRLAPVAAAVTTNGAVRPALADFEHWYQGSAGAPFYALFDVYVPEAPLVDF